MVQPVAPAVWPPPEDEEELTDLYSQLRILHWIEVDKSEKVGEGGLSSTKVGRSGAFSQVS